MGNVGISTLLLYRKVETPKWCQRLDPANGVRVSSRCGLGCQEKENRGA